MVEWEGYTEKANSWVEEGELQAPQLIEQFERVRLGDDEDDEWVMENEMEESDDDEEGSEEE